MLGWAGRSDLHSNSKIGVGIRTTLESNSNIGNGIHISFKSNSNIGNGIHISLQSNSEIGVGSHTSLKSKSNIGIGMQLGRQAMLDMEIRFDVVNGRSMIAQSSGGAACYAPSIPCCDLPAFRATYPQDGFHLRARSCASRLAINFAITGCRA